jgi:hypothetical protein
MRTRAALFALLLLASCASPEPTPPKAPAPPPPPETPTVAPVQTQATPLQPPPRRATDSCGAYELQGLVGKQRSDIPVPVDPSRRRVACTTCPVTQDFREDRLNIFFDADTGVVKSVTCG